MPRKAHPFANWPKRFPPEVVARMIGQARRNFAVARANRAAQGIDPLADWCRENPELAAAHRARGTEAILLLNQGRHRAALPLDEAPIFEPLILATIAPRIIVREAPPLILPTFGLTADDLAFANAAETEHQAREIAAAEDFARSMFRDCQHCGRSFLPDRKTSRHCSRECYLADYRKREAARYAAYTRKWRGKRDIAAAGT